MARKSTVEDDPAEKARIDAAIQRGKFNRAPDGTYLNERNLPAKPGDILMRDEETGMPMVRMTDKGPMAKSALVI